MRSLIQQIKCQLKLMKLSEFDDFFAILAAHLREFRSYINFEFELSK
jgi:hypothetical protein